MFPEMALKKMAFDYPTTRVEEVRIDWESSCPDDYPNITAYTGKLDADEDTDLDLRTTTVPLIKDWFERYILDIQAIEKGVIRMLEGVFDITEEDPPYAEVASGQADFGLCGRGRPWVSLPFGLDRGFKAFRKRDDRVRYISLSIRDQFCKLDISDEDYNGFNYEELNLSSMKLDFLAIAEGGLIIAKAMGLITSGKPNRPIISRENVDCGSYKSLETCKSGCGVRCPLPGKNSRIFC